jgi:hypothetical protein
MEIRKWKDLVLKITFMVLIILRRILIRLSICRNEQSLTTVEVE